MKMSRRITNGLAWTGLAIVVGVPTVELLARQFIDNDARAGAVIVSGPTGRDTTTAATPPVPQPRPAETAAAAVPPTPTASTDPLERFRQSGRPLPSYLSGTGTAAPSQTATAPAATPAPAAPATPVATPSPTSAPQATTQTPTTPPVETIPLETPVTETASLGPQRVAPVPAPLSQRPRPVQQASVPLTQSPALVVPDRSAPVPPALVEPEFYDDIISAEDLEAWDTGPLSEFLSRRANGGSTATFRREAAPAPVYEERQVYVYPLID